MTSASADRAEWGPRLRRALEIRTLVGRPTAHVDAEGRYEPVGIDGQRSFDADDEDVVALEDGIDTTTSPHCSPTLSKLFASPWADDDPA
jgi:hypothetical protein